MLPCKFNMQLPSSFAFKRNAWRWGETLGLRDQTWSWSSKLLVFQECLVQDYEVLLHLWLQVLEKQIVPLWRMFFCLALQSAVSFTSEDLSTNHHSSIDPVSTLVIMPHIWFLSPCWVYVSTFFPMDNCPYTTFSFSAEPTETLRTFCCMEWVLKTKYRQ